MSETDVQAAAPDAAAIPEKPEVPSWRLVLTLTVAGALAALALSMVYEATLPAIMANRAKVLKEAVGVVLKEPARVVSLKVEADGLVVDDDVVYQEESGVTRVYFGWNDAGQPIGFAVVGAAYGYGSDPIKLIFGYDAQSKEILGLKVLDHKETPGIGTKIEDAGTPFVDQWWNPPGDSAKARKRTVARQAPVVGIRADKAPSDDVHEVDMISGATISAKAIIRVVNDAVAVHGEKLAAWDPASASQSAPEKAPEGAE